ncbi:ABC-type polysaccharide/polyol phosphate export permease [Tranquillimonas rosea]|uniref:ABC-type polysaccharide/polyol phosphate export permease n=1 Tax=Tranquillimonas rosea TaxID=641238 RepID=A0A1H9UIT4_9RHOB|nr:ABC transporter permease [Tranquillimonas rosea]SES09346.1 ABC-type polysaccharide/polyol phosphate export permease [Tranquillimonas rosea]
MFQRPQRETGLASAAGIADLIYHNTVRNVRKTHSNALFAILINIFQTVVFVMIFYLLFVVLGMRGQAIRGDFMLYIMTGIFLYMVHTRVVQSIISSEGPASPMMKHAPMTTAISIASAALGSLYIQVLSMACVLYVYHVGWGPITIHDPRGAFGMVFLAWFSGVGVGIIFLAIKPWAPSFVSMTSMIYTRANMIASGKMFVANTLPAVMLPYFTWNPLFHVIDQARGFTFVNYWPHNSAVMYPVYVSLGLLMVGMMGEFYTRKHASISWSARR